MEHLPHVTFVRPGDIVDVGFAEVTGCSDTNGREQMRGASRPNHGAERAAVRCDTGHRHKTSVSVMTG